MTDPEPPLAELPSYLGDERDEAAGRERPGVREVVARAAARVGELVDGDGELAPAATIIADPRDVDDVVVVQRVLGDPAVLRERFDRRWGAQPSRTRAALGTLYLRPDDGAGRARVLHGRFTLRTALMAVPVTLTLDPWQTYGVVLQLQPERARSHRMGRARRWAWFRAGHAVLDQMRRALEAS